MISLKQCQSYLIAFIITCVVLSFAVQACNLVYITVWSHDFQSKFLCKLRGSFPTCTDTYVLFYVLYTCFLCSFPHNFMSADPLGLILVQIHLETLVLVFYKGIIKLLSGLVPSGKYIRLVSHWFTMLAIRLILIIGVIVCSHLITSPLLV